MNPVSLSTDELFFVHSQAREPDSESDIELRVDGVTRACSLRHVPLRRDDSNGEVTRNIAFFREGGIAEARNFIELDYSWSPLNFATDWNKKSQGVIQRLARLWRPPANPRAVGAIIYHDGLGRVIYRLREKNGNNTWLIEHHFRWRKHPLSLTEFFDWPNARFQRTLCGVWDNPRSQMRAAFRFEAATSAERDDWAFACRNGHWNELRAAFWPVVVLFSYAVAGEESQWHLDLRPTRLPHGTAPTIHAWNRACERWREILCAEFEPLYAFRLQKPPAFVRAWIEQRHAQFCWPLAPVTMHEVLEARLDATQWLLPRVGAARLPEFLPL